MVVGVFSGFFQLAISSFNVFFRLGGMVSQLILVLFLRFVRFSPSFLQVMLCRRKIGMPMWVNIAQLVQA